MLRVGYKTYADLMVYRNSKREFLTLIAKHAASGEYEIAQAYLYRQEKACLLEQSPWRAATDPRLASGRFRA